MERAQGAQLNGTQGELRGWYYGRRDRHKQSTHTQVDLMLIFSAWFYDFKKQ